jgi:hypothetical protein
MRSPIRCFSKREDILQHRPLGRRKLGLHGIFRQDFGEIAAHRTGANADERLQPVEQAFDRTCCVSA